MGVRWPMPAMLSGKDDLEERWEDLENDIGASRRCKKEGLRKKSPVQSERVFRDRDKSFTRRSGAWLQTKPLPPEGDHYRTRLTHARWSDRPHHAQNSNEDPANLGHDSGHNLSPYGRGGVERTRPQRRPDDSATRGKPAGGRYFRGGQAGPPGGARISQLLRDRLT